MPPSTHGRSTYVPGPSSPFVNLSTSTKGSVPNQGSGRPIDEYDQMPFGKHKGILIRDVPVSYLTWAAHNCNFCDRNSEQYWPEFHDLLVKILSDKNGAPLPMRLTEFCAELKRRRIKLQMQGDTVVPSQPIDEDLRPSFLAHYTYLLAVMSVVDAPTPRRSGSMKTILAGEVRNILREWYRKIVIRFHPDRGGTPEAMNAIATSYGELRDALAEWEKVITKSEPGATL